MFTPNSSSWTAILWSPPRRLAPLALAAALAFLGSPAPAIDIVPVYDSASSEPPATDPSGALLSSIVDRAAQIWEEAFPGITHTVDIDFRWQDDPKAFLGIHDADLELGRTSRSISGRYTIRFFTHFQDGTEIPWFIDSTPEDDVEFTGGPQQLLRADYTSGAGITVGGGVYAPLPKALEISYGIQSDSTDATASQVDLLTVALHEMGHAIALNFWVVGIRSYYDPPSSLCNRYICTTTAGTCTVRIAATTSGSHLDVPTLMQPSLTNGVRLYPSQVDILALAAARGWTSVNFPRKEMLPRATSTAITATLRWDYTTSWFGAQLPDQETDANIRWPFIGTVEIHADSVAKNLNLGSTGTLTSGGLLLKTGTYRLYAADTVTTDNDLTELRVEEFGALQAQNAIVINGGSTLHLLSSSQAQVFGDRLQIKKGELYTEGGDVSAPNIYVEAEGTFWGRGNVVNIATLRNDGLIKAYEGDLYFIGLSPEAPMDLDGDAFQGKVEAVSGGISFQGSFPDDFSGDMKVGKWIAFVHPSGWSLGTTDPRTATLALQGDDAIVTSPFTNVGPLAFVTVSAARTCFDSPLRFSAGSKLYLSKATASVGFLGDTEYQGGTFTGSGAIYQVGDVSVPEGKSVQIDVGKYVWDGEGWLGVTPGDSRTTIEPYAQLRITKDITSLGSDGYDGVVMVKANAVLQVDRDWQLDGDLCLDGGTVKGGTITVSSSGTIRGTGTIAANVVNEGTIYCDGSVTFTGSLTQHGTVTADCPACP